MNTQDQLHWPSLTANGKALCDPVAVTVDGTAVVLARAQGQVSDHLYYNVRFSNPDALDGNQEYSGWYELNLAAIARSPEQGVLPEDSLRVLGSGLITLPATAQKPAPADAPFAALVDGQHICVFRPSQQGSLYLDRFILIQVPTRRDDDDHLRRDNETDQPTRFALERVWELRYRGSRRKDTPADSRDVLGYRDMMSQPFIEPTLELTGIPAAPAGRFTMLLLPTAIVDRKRWYLFVAATDSVQARTWPQTEDGLFDFSPVPKDQRRAAAGFELKLTLPTASQPLPLHNEAGLTVVLFAEQDENAAGDRQKQALRVLLAVPVSASGLPRALAVLDFGILPDGYLPTPPASLSCPLLDGSLEGGHFQLREAERYPIPETVVTLLDNSTLYSYTLGAVAPSATPFLLDGGDGLVHCYYAGQGEPNRQALLVAQYDPVVTRPTVGLSWRAGAEQGRLELLARRAGTTFNKLKIAVTDSSGADVADLCAMSVDYNVAASGIGTEHWRGLPRELTAMAEVLNGRASGELFARDVQNGSQFFFDYSGTRRQARLPQDDQGHFVLVSSREDLALVEVKVKAAKAADQRDLELVFEQQGKRVAQTWRQLPANARGMRSVLRGDTSPDVYPYKPDAADNVAYGLAAAGGTLLLLAAAGSTALSVEVAAGSAANTVDVSIGGAIQPLQLKGLPQDSVALAAALLADSRVNAIFPVISAGADHGPVLQQQAGAPLDLRALSTLFGSLPPDTDSPVSVATVVADYLQSHWQDAPQPETPLPGRLQALVASTPAQPVSGQKAVIANQSADASQAHANGAWLSAKPLYALALDAKSAMVVPSDSANFDFLSPGREYTLETWLRPGNGNTARVLSFNGRNAGSTPTWQVAPSFFLSVFNQPCLEYGAFTGADFTPSSYVSVQANPQLAPREAFTWEVWINPAQTVCAQGKIGSVLQLADPENPSLYALEVGLDDQRRPVLVANDGRDEKILRTTAPLPASVWTHLALTSAFDAAEKQWRHTLYINGETTAVSEVLLPMNWPSAPALYIGGAGNTNHVSFFGCMAEVRFWHLRRTLADIRDSLYYTLAGTEPGLVGYWLLSEPVSMGSTMANSCPAGLHMDGTVFVAVKQPIQQQTHDGTFLAMAAGIGGAPAQQANAFLRSTHWNHVAVTYRAGTAVHCDANRQDCIDCGNDGNLNVNDAFTIESWLQADPVRRPVPQALVAKWGQEAADQAYWLGLDASGALQVQALYAVKSAGSDTSFKPVSFKVDRDLRDGKPHHVVATLSTDTCINNDDPRKSEVVVIVKLYIDGAPVGTTNVKVGDGIANARVQATTGSLVLGSSFVPPKGAAPNTAPEARMFLNGMLTGVVLWSRAVEDKDIRLAFEQRLAMQRDGAVASWWFREQAGRDAVDDVGGIVARLSGNGLWAVFNRLSELLFYSNGRRLLAVRVLPDAQAYGYPSGAAQFTLGASQDGNVLKDPLLAQINELRLWQHVRSPRQVADLRFTQLVGDEEGLAGYWNFNGKTLVDLSRFGNNAQMWQGAPQPFPRSAAPVANEGPEIRNIYGGQLTEFQRNITGTPAVIESSVVNRTPSSALQPAPMDGQAGALVGALTRIYAYTTGSVNVSAGFYAGPLTLRYLGQVQTDPTLLGYIEGAPPVPSENLTRPYYGSPIGWFNYFNSSSITFTNTETTTLSFNSSFSRGGTLDHTTSGGFNGNYKALTGQFYYAQVNAIDFQIGPKEKGGFASQDLQVHNAASSWALALSDTLSLRGDWEGPERKDWANPQVGRRFVPANLGYALVSSLTADVYLTFNTATGAAVGRAVVPNPDIPPDRNIITFEMDPTYTKNGTLDGKVGLFNDPDYPKADTRRGSYFKPMEAYRLKRDIAKKALDQERYWGQFDAYKRALASNHSLDDQADTRFVERSKEGTISRKGIANTYVWTASGGMHTEQEQFTDTFTTTFTGGYNVNNQFGVTSSLKTGPIGGYFSLDWMGGFKIDISVSKTRAQGSALGMNVIAIGEPALLGWDESAKSYGSRPVPGKVAAYRFNTFYLPPSSDHGELLRDSIVDPVWLRSNSPDAVALRSARTDNPAWRVLHRVTYVNRIPPEFDSTPNQTLEEVVPQIIDLANNQVLVDLVHTALHGSAPTPANIGSAVSAVMNPVSKDGSFPPSLLGKLVPWWEAFLASTRGNRSNEANRELLQQLQLDVLDYIRNGLLDHSLDWS